MTVFEILILAGLILLLLVAVLILLKVRNPHDGLTAQLEALLSGRLREDQRAEARAARDELSSRIDGMARSLLESIGAVGNAQGSRLDSIQAHVAHEQKLAEDRAASLRHELTQSFSGLADNVTRRMADQGAEHGEKLEGFRTQLVEHRTTAGVEAKALREEVSRSLTTIARQLTESLDRAAKRQSDMLGAATEQIRLLQEANEQRQETLRKTVETRLDAIREENAAKLEEMRRTVDEKLQGTLEQRLGASFQTVNENLERVYRSVGEMQNVAAGVGDLKRVLSNVKSRGTWGETTLGMLLEQVMTTEQYASNVEIRPGSGQRVEFAVRLPGDEDSVLWLPIDAKLPTEDYERLMDASDAGDPQAVEDAVKALERAIRKCASDISTKYVSPPHSTDFGIMFLPTEGLFAEVVRRPGLVDGLQRDYRVIVAGPTTLLALLTSLRMGFRTLAIQKRSSEVWQVLGAVKTEFGKFGDVLDKVQKKLDEAKNVVESAGTRRRAVDRKLKAIEALPEAVAQEVLAITAEDLANAVEDETLT